MALRRLCFLLSVTSVLAFAACGDNRHERDDAGIDGSGSDVDASVDAPPDALDCTGAGEMVCNGLCVNTNTDNANCGACDTPCAGSCQAGKCCAAGQTNCGGTCVDLTIDEAHCGTCATTCDTGAGQTCTTNGGVSKCCGPTETNCNGVCVDINSDEANCGGCGAAFACAGATNTCCGGSCVDPTNDEAHCGSCTTTCNTGANETCTTDNGASKCCGPTQTNCSGTCTDITINDSNCGGCNIVCDTGAGITCIGPSTNSSGVTPECCGAGQNNCGDACSNPLTDNNNCGGCGNVCGSGTTCTDGICCGPGESRCGSTCVDLLNDPLHCGSCPGACTAAEPVCSGGGCTTSCASNETQCGNSCVDTDSDHENCGGCNAPCTDTQVCNNGVCSTTCAIGETLCGGDCVNLTNDENHCGTCPNTCAPTDICENSACHIDCGAGTLWCGGTDCHDPLNDELNCGGCAGAGGVVCAQGSTCDGGLCCTAGQEYVEDLGTTATDGKCCTIGYINCGGVCTDPKTTEAHCGTCTNACGGTDQCLDGSCCTNGFNKCSGSCSNPLTDNANCGGCGIDCGSDTCSNGICCGAGEQYTEDTGTAAADGICCPSATATSPAFINCGGTCFNPDTSAEHCGGCAAIFQCGASEVCAAGSCNAQCLPNPPYNTTCGVCTDPLTDADHCGAGCDNCPTGAACNSGTCQTCAQANPAKPDICNNACTNILTDPTNCGTCNHFCAGGETCTDGTCCAQGLTACNGLCIDTSSDELNCGGCGATDPTKVCATGSVCNAGVCECGVGQEICGTSCKTLATDPLNCGQCGNVCPTNGPNAKPYCVSGGCTATCPLPLSNCDIGGNHKCVNKQDDSLNCGNCGNTCPDGKGCSGGLCVPVIPVGPDPAKCVGGGPPIVVPTGGGQQTCTGNLGATSFLFGMCSRTNIGPLSRALFTDAFNSTSGPYVASCSTDPDCGPLRCRNTDVLCTGTAGTVGSCLGGSDDICEYRVPCVGGTCVGGGVGVNGMHEGAVPTEAVPVVSNTANTHVGGEFWVFGTTGLAMKGDTQVKQRFFNQGTIEVGKVSTIWGAANVKGGWTSGGNPDMLIKGPLTTQLGSCSPQPLPLSDLTLQGGCSNAAFPSFAPPCGTSADVVPVQDIVDYFRLPQNNDNDLLDPDLDPAILTAPTTTVRIDLPCGYYYFDQMNIGKDTTIVVHGRTAIFVGGAVRVSQKLTFDLTPTATLDIFVGGAVNVSNVVTLGSPAYPRLTRLWVGGTGCTGTGTCSNAYDCCSGICTGGVCGAGGGGNLTQAISLSNGGFFNGLLYAGRGEFSHSNPLEMYGAIFANYIDASGDTIVHYDAGARQAFEECQPDVPTGSCESCKNCANQACVNGQCGACTSDAQCCVPLTCELSTGTCR